MHDGYHTLVARARLLKANGNTANHVRVVIHEVGHRGPDSVLGIVSPQAVAHVDTWLTDILADGSDKPQAQKVAAHRPADLVDACYTAADAQITDMDVCAELFPIASDARLVAGAPLANDVLKCTLKPVNPNDYMVNLSAEQLGALRRIFAEGCVRLVKTRGRPGAARRHVGVLHGQCRGQVPEAREQLIDGFALLTLIIQPSCGITCALLQSASHSSAVPVRSGEEVREMRRRYLACAALVALVSAGIGVSAAQDAVEPATGWTVPRTSWGDPDLQGVWNTSGATPLERPDRYAGRELLTDEELGTLLEQARNPEERPARPGDPGTYNRFWD